LPLRAADAGVWTEAEAAREIQTEGPVKLNKSITIDAGHGGHDPGALSPRGLREKDVALKVVTMTAALLTPVMGVYLTRKDDRFLELADRAAIANRNGSDFFLSVHCNSGPP